MCRVETFQIMFTSLTHVFSRVKVPGYSQKCVLYWKLLTTKVQKAETNLHFPISFLLTQKTRIQFYGPKS